MSGVGGRGRSTRVPTADSRRTTYDEHMNWLIKNFLRGLVIVVPIVLTLYLLYQAFTWVDRLLSLKTPGTGFAITIAAVIVIGALASNLFVSKFFSLTEK